MKTVAAAEANRRFSALLRDVAHGEEVLVMAHGKPVAKISPATDAVRERTGARATLLIRLHSQTPTGTRTWTRDQLYD